MDPTATWRAIEDRLAEGDVPGAIDAAGELALWLGKGGFMPHGPAYYRVLQVVGFLLDLQGRVDATAEFCAACAADDPARASAAQQAMDRSTECKRRHPSL